MTARAFRSTLEYSVCGVIIDGLSAVQFIDPTKLGHFDTLKCELQRALLAYQKISVAKVPVGVHALACLSPSFQLKYTRAKPGDKLPKIKHV